MIIWGTGGDLVQLGPAGEAHCRNCDGERSFHNVLAYRYAHVWYLFSWVTRKQYMTVCGTCSRGIEHEAKAFEARLGKSPIPFYRRYGGLALIGLIAVVVLAGMLGAHNTSRNDEAFLAGPRVGDRYSVDLAQVFPGGYDGAAYGVVRIAAVDGDRVTLQAPQHGYGRWSDADKEIEDGVSTTSSYYVADATRVVSAAQLRQWHPQVLHHAAR